MSDENVFFRQKSCEVQKNSVNLPNECAVWTMFEQEIKHYEQVRCEYEERIVKKMAPADYMDWHEVLFSTHSCAIEGNSFTVDDTRILKEQGLAMVPVGHSLL